jgi:hypothetical protein
MQPIHVKIPANSAANTSSTWVRFDQWNIGDIAAQINVTGTVNYTLQTTFDDPNDPVSPVDPANVLWTNSTDANVVNSTKDAVTKIDPAPIFARILLNSGTGSIDATFVQQGSTPK